MVKKATEVMSLEELGLQERTCNYLRRTHGSLGTIIKEGRNYAFSQDCGTLHLNSKSPKWISELVAALRAKGFVRPATDFVTSFNVANLYATVSFPKCGVTYPDYSGKFLTNIAQLSNEQYEDFERLAGEEIERVKQYLSQTLDEMGCGVICGRFGLDGEVKDLETIARCYNISTDRVRKLESKALRKLRYASKKLPAVFEATEEMNEKAEKLNAELERIYESPAFIRAGEIVAELEYMRKLPFKYGCKCLIDGAEDQTLVDEMGLSVRTRNRLRRAGISTVADIINLPKDGWFKIRFLGRQSVEEVVDKMHTLGYDEFNVEIPETLRRWPAV